MQSKSKNKTGEIARDFLDAYQDPEIDKRLFFEVWADRAGLDLSVKRKVWGEVLKITYQVAARKREATRQRRAVITGGQGADRDTRVESVAHV